MWAYAGTDVAVESAGIVLVRSDPRDVVRAIELSRATYRKMAQNLLWATAYNLLAIPMAAGVLIRWGLDLPMSVGAMAMSLSTIIVALNAQLLRRLKLGHRWAADNYSQSPSPVLGVVAVALVLLMSACTASKKPSKLETTLANIAKDVVIPLEAQNLKNPVPATDENIQAGQVTYLQQCALCHAADGRAATKLGLAMYPPAMDLNSPHVQRWTDAELFWIIQNGVRLTGMPAWKTIVSEQDTWKVVNFIHALPKLASILAEQQKGAEAAKSQAELVAYGRKLYRQEGCWGCHQLDGEGGKVGPDLTVEGARERSDEWLVGHFKDPSAYTPGSVMFSFKQLTDEQLRALTTFLQSQKGPKPK